jgi:hypothetical protein
MALDAEKNRVKTKENRLSGMRKARRSPVWTITAV